MDALQQTIVRLSEQGITVKQIARRTGTSEQKVRRVLITMGLWSSPLSERIHRMHSSGKTLVEIAAALGMTRNNVTSYLPYNKGMYNAEYPTTNALRIRACRESKKGANNNDQP